MITVYKQKDTRTKYYISITLFLVLLLIIGPISYFYGITYLISVITNKFFEIVMNLAPLLSYIGVCCLIMYYYYFIFIHRTKMPIALSVLIVLGLFFLASSVMYVLNGVYLVNNIKAFLFKNYYDFHFLLGFLLLLIGIAVFIIELVSFIKGKNSIANLLVDKTLIKFKKSYAFPFILLTILFLYLFYSFFTYIFISQKFNIESVFIGLILFVNIFDYLFALNSFKQRISNFSLINLFVLNAFMIVLFISLEIDNPSFLIHYIKPICPLDYAISFPVLPILILLNMVGTTAISLLSVLSFKQK